MRCIGAPAFYVSMHVDLLTLYFLAIGTLFASAGMTFWEHRTHPKRSPVLKILATAYATLGLGCAGVLLRHQVPGFVGSALSNLVILTGYQCVLHAVARLSGERYVRFSIAIVGVQAIAWIVGGSNGEYLLWNYGTAIPIALTNGVTAWAVLRSAELPSTPSRRFLVVIFTLHTIFYVFRAAILPWLVARFGIAAQSLASTSTMYEGVMYSVLMPMTFLKLFRDEAHSELLHASLTDYLTRLGNRRWFFEEGARAINENVDHRPVSLLAFDLDQFKLINDRYGHKTGDEVLKAFARVAVGVLGPDVVLARIGGEEFAALLPGRDGLDAKKVGEVVARHFAQTVAHRVNGVAIQATVSIGLAEFGRGGLALSDLLASADQALYRAKSLGGNRLEVAQSSTAPATV